MQLQALLDHNDFMAALDAYVRQHFPVPEGTVPNIDITAGRGDKGYSAVVTYASAGDTQQAPSASTVALSASLKEQGNTTTRLGKDPLPKAEAQAEPEKEEASAGPVESLPVAEVVHAEDSGDVSEAEQVEEAVSKPAVQPLFSFNAKG